MYSQLLKEILLEMTYDDEAIGVLVDFCRENFAGNEKQLEIINEFARDYSKHTPIWWYTRECFTYRMLNHSLRTVDIDIIAMMGFLMKDVHEQIKDLYSKRSDRMTPFRVYRGQGMLDSDFEKIRNNIGGLFAFNSFLSTSIELNVAMKFVPKTTSNKIQVLFIMEIDPTITSIPFAALNNVSYYEKKEVEILFSMHTIFRIDGVQEKEKYLWEITLKSVSDNDVQMTRLIKQMRHDIGGGSAINRLGQLMINLGELKKAEDLYEVLLNSTPKNDEKALARIYNQIGYIKHKQDDYQTAKSFYQKARDIQEKLRPSTDLDLATTYSNIGLLYTAMGDSSNARSYHQKALDIREKLLEKNHLDLATTYNNIGLVCDQLRDYPTALSYYEKTLAIYQKSLPSNHPWLATIYKNIGLAQISTGKHSIGLDNLRTAMEIRKLALPSNHPSIASICSTIGGVYRKMGDDATALTFYEQALDIEKRVSQRNYYSLAMVYYDMSRACHNLNQYDVAVKYADLAVQSASKSLPSDHEDFIKLKKNFEQLRTKL
jgi:tetratricopeptide (TPR) repeat protein